MWSQKPGDGDVKGKRTSQQIIPERAREGRETHSCVFSPSSGNRKKLSDGAQHCLPEATLFPASNPHSHSHTSSLGMWVFVILKGHLWPVKRLLKTWCLFYLGVSPSLNFSQDAFRPFVWKQMFPFSFASSNYARQAQALIECYLSMKL